MASNNNTGFTVPKGPKDILTPDQAKKRHEENLKGMQDQLAELRSLIDGLEELVS